MTDVPSSSDYQSTDTYLADLREYAWMDQDRLVKSKHSSSTIHIPPDDETRDSICRNGPSTDCPSNDSISVYPGSFRDGMEWCQFCLSLEYAGTQFYRLRREINQNTGARPDCVVTVDDSRTVYHTRACGVWPRRVRAATEGEVGKYRECERCRDVKRGRRDPVVRGLVGRVPDDGSEYDVPVSCVERNARIRGD